MDKNNLFETPMKIAALVLAILATALSPSSFASDRWYDAATVEKGRTLFQQTCSNCHGLMAEGTSNWKQKDAAGNYPPPPLDGSAHAWHHSIPQLARSIKEGGIAFGGTMPAFGDQFSDPEILALISYFQSRWPDEIYEIWQQRHLQ